MFKNNTTINNAALLSIKPKYFKLIQSQTKLFEYRKTIFNKNVRLLFFYITSPVKLVQAYSKSFDIFTGTPEEIWNSTQNDAGIDENQYYQYFNNSNRAYAIKINELIMIKSPLKIKDFCEKEFAPQNFYYLNTNTIKDGILS